MKRIAISGATGLVGTALCERLTADGHSVLRLVRRPSANDTEVSWSPLSGLVETDKLEGVAAIVHLAGVNVGQGRWTAERMDRIRSSRFEGTGTLARALAALASPPSVLVSASGTGFYGDCQDRLLHEGSPHGAGFLADVCRVWEQATKPAAAAGIRVVHLRIGPVISGRGGMLAKLRGPFGLGLGGRVGTGRQYLSWIAIDDLISAIVHVIRDTRARGPVNATAPNPVTNAELTRVLGRVLKRPTVLPLPALVVKTMFGQMGQELLLYSQRALPSRLEQLGFEFRFSSLERAVRHELGRP